MKLALFTVCVFCSVLAKAEQVAYVELAANAMPQKIADERFHLGVAELRAGAYLHNLIAIEFMGSIGAMDDTAVGLEQTLKSGYGVGLRFESPSQDGTKAFIVLGYSSHSLELTRESSGATLADERFEGFAYGVGLEQRLSGDDGGFFMNIRGQRHYSSGEIDIDSVGVALRYVF